MTKEQFNKALDVRERVDTVELNKKSIGDSLDNILKILSGNELLSKIISTAHSYFMAASDEQILLLQKEMEAI